MENASKALIIAGAILISILLISVGIIIFNSGAGITDDASSASKSLAATTFNSRFTKYFGTSVSASQVQAFIRTVMANNSIDDNRIVYINAHNKSGSYFLGHGHAHTTSHLQTILTYINDGTTYTIQKTSGCGTYTNDGYDDDGYIRCIHIQEN